MRRGELALRQRNPHLAGYRAYRLGKADVLHLHDEREDVAVLMTAEAVIAGSRRIKVEGAGLFLMKWAEGRPVRARLSQLHIVANNAHDIGLLLDGLCKAVRHVRARLSVRPATLRPTRTPETLPFGPPTTLKGAVIKPLSPGITNLCPQ